MSTVSLTAGNTYLRAFDIFFDPRSAVQRIDLKSSWLIPLMIVGIGSVILNLASLPTILSISEQNLPIGLSANQEEVTMVLLERNLRIGIILSPLVIVLKWLAAGALLFSSCILLNIDVKFKRLLTLFAQCSLIILMQDLLRYIVVRLRSDELISQKDLSFGLSLDLLFDGLNPPVMATISYFSVFNIWWTVVLALGLFHITGCSKAKAFAAVTANWMLPLVLVIGLAFLQQ